MPDINSLTNKSSPNDTDNLVIQQADGQGFKLSIANLLAATRADIAALQAQFNSYIPLSQKGAAGGVATLGTDGKVPAAQLPAASSGSNTSNDSSVILLLNFQGTNGSQSILDTSSTPKAITVGGNAQIQSNRLLLDGNGDYLQIAKAAIDITAYANLTIEAIVSPTTTSNQLIFTTYRSPNQSNHIILSTTELSNGLASQAALTTPTNTNTHYAFVKSSGTNRLYRNGVLVNTNTLSYAQNGDFFIGGSPGDNNIGTRWFNGSIIGFRISNTARYSSDFTPPSNFL